MLTLAIISGVVQYALAFWLYIVGLKGIPAGMAGLFLTTTPVFGVIGGIAFLGEQITLLQVSGIGCVMLGLCWVLWVEAGDRPA
jgi:drug/metabolite transporter (DMT)-like permease